MNRLERFGMWLAGIQPQQLLPPTPIPIDEMPQKRSFPAALGHGFDALISRASPQRAESGALYKPPVMPARVKPTGMATDSMMACDYSPAYAYANLGGGFAYGGFMGYPALSELAQVAEYRVITNVPVREMLRKGWKLTYKGDASPDAGEILGRVEDELNRLKCKDALTRALRSDGFFGRGQIYIDMVMPGGAKAWTNDNELAKPLVLDPAKIAKGSVAGFKVIEPLWTYPNLFNADNPLGDNFYVPEAWYVMGKQVDASRLITFVAEHVPDIFKPSYNFGGLSRSQLCMKYVIDWIKTRDNVTRAIGNFSTSGFKTNMAAILSGVDDPNFAKRIKAYSAVRDNLGVTVLDMATEEFFQFNMPLGGLSDLQKDKLEQLCMVSHCPAVKLLGVQPSGMNADSDGEIQVFYDYIAARQREELDAPLTMMINLAQLNLGQAIDPNIGFEWQPLEEANEKELADVRKSEADRATSYITAGVISPEEERQRLSDDPNSGFNFIDPTDVPDPPPMMQMGGGDPDEDGDDDSPPAKDAAIEERDGGFWVGPRMFRTRADAEQEVLLHGGLQGTRSTGEFERTSRF